MSESLWVQARREGRLSPLQVERLKRSRPQFSPRELNALSFVVQQVANYEPTGEFRTLLLRSLRKLHAVGAVDYDPNRRGRARTLTVSPPVAAEPPFGAVSTSRTKLCECGCGELAPLAIRTRVGRGQVKGEPLRFVHGHHALTMQHRAKVAEMGRKHGSENANKRRPKPRYGEDNPSWRGEKAGRAALHAWALSHYRKYGICENCDARVSGPTEWANRSNEYRRERDDWVELCVRCHRHLDANPLVAKTGEPRRTHLVGIPREARSGLTRLYGATLEPVRCQ